MATSAEPAAILRDAVLASARTVPQDGAGGGSRDARAQRLSDRSAAVAPGQDTHPGAGARAVTACAARGARQREGRRARPAGAARLVEGALRRDRKERRRKSAPQMGGDAHAYG